VSAIEVIRDARNPALRAEHKAVMWAIASRLPDAPPSVEGLAADAAMGRSTCYRALRDLRAWGMVGARGFDLDLDRIRSVDGAQHAHSQIGIETRGQSARSTHHPAPGPAPTSAPPFQRIAVPVPPLAALDALGLALSATVDEVRRAFRQKAKTAHPDRGGDLAAFQRLEAHYRAALAWAERST
jgi:hypothetical protein